jgi:hypothetical protein
LAGDSVATGVKGHGIAVTGAGIIDKRACGRAVKQQGISIEGKKAVAPVGVTSDLGSPLGTDIAHPDEVCWENAVFEGFGPASEGSELGSVISDT